MIKYTETLALILFLTATASASNVELSNNIVMSNGKFITDQVDISRKGDTKTPRLTLDSFKIVDTNGNVHFEMDNAGKFGQEGKAIGKINVNGLVVNMQGKPLAHLRSNDILEDSKGQPLVKIDHDGSIDNGSGVLIHWLKDGTLSKGNEAMDIKLIPADSNARRTASILIFLYFSIEEVTTVEVKDKQ